MTWFGFVQRRDGEYDGQRMLKMETFMDVCEGRFGNAKDEEGEMEADDPLWQLLKGAPKRRML